MLLAIDIGNSSTKFGVFDSSSLLDRFSIPTERDYTVDELGFDRLQRPAGRFLGIDTVIVSSVVPEMDGLFRDAIRKHLNVEPRFVDHTFEFGLKINYQPPSAIGIDRLINASAASRKYGVPVIACSFGTATTIDLVNGNSEFSGGAIAPGMRLLSESLHRNTSQLPLITVQEPKSVFGNTTQDSIQAGVFFGYVGMVRGIIERMAEEFRGPVKVVGTGGFVKVAAANVSLINVVDENLTLDGLRMLAEHGQL